MINSHELRLGNLILHNNEQCEVFSLSKEWLRVTKDRNIAISYDNIAGIKLSNEWFERLGFKEERCDDIVTEFRHGRISILFDRVHEWCSPALLSGRIIKTDSGIKSEIFLESFDGHVGNCVHSLQNFYYTITGEELTTNNTTL